MSNEARKVSDAIGTIGTGRPDPRPVSVDYLRERATAERAGVHAWSEERARARRASQLACVPGAFQGLAFGGQYLEQRCSDPRAIAAAYGSVAHLLCGSVPAVVLIGAAGAGKTSLAAAIARAVVESGQLRVGWTDAYSLSRAYRDARMGIEPEAITRAKRVGLLVLDELGSEAQGRDVVRELAHERHAEGRPTVVTTWLGSGAETDRKEACMSSVREMYGDGTARRLFERGLLIEIGGV